MDVLVIAGLTALVAVVLVIQGMLRAEWGVAVLVAMAFTNAAASSGSANLLPAGLAVLFGAAALIRRRAAGPDALVPFAAVAGLLWAVALLSVLWARSPERTVEQVTDLAFQIALAVGIVACISAPRHLRWGAWAIVLSGSLLGALAIVQSATGDYSWTALGLAQADLQQISGLAHGYRAGGPVGDANFFGQMMVVVLALALERARAARAWPQRLLSTGAVLITLGTLAITYSRGALLATAVVLVLAVIRMRHRTVGVAIGIVALMGVLAATPADYAARVAQVPAALESGLSEGSADPAITGRMSSWIVARDMALDSPLVGVGYGQYPVEYLDYSAHVGLDWRGEPRAPHSLPLQLLAELGLVGLLLMGAVVAGAFVSIRRARGDLRSAAEGTEGRDTYSLLGGLNDGILAYLVAGVFLHSAHPAVLWVLLALGWSAVQVVGPVRRAPVVVMDRMSVGRR